LHAPPRILVVDDTPENLEIMGMRLQAHGYDIVTAVDGEDALVKVDALMPDLILLDIMMPKLDGIAVTKRLKADPARSFIPIVLLTAKATSQDVVAGLDAGADDYLTKPVEHGPMVARVRSMLRIKELHDALQGKTAELASLNDTLEARVAEQVGEIQRMSRLKRFLAPQVAELVLSAPDDALLRNHRCDIAVLFCDVRGFTSFAETAEPEEVMGVLREYHADMGKLILEHDGTLERFTGDGMMIFFNDPVPVPDPAERAIKMAFAMRDRVHDLAKGWEKRGYDLALGVGIAQGYATIGAIGFEGRWDYGAIGTVTNLAARLCGEAKGGQILVSPRVAGTLENLINLEEVGKLTLKGFSRPVPTFSALGLKTTEA